MLLMHVLTAIGNAARAVALPSLLLSLIVCGLIVVSGWQRRRDLLARQSRRGIGRQFELGQTPFVSGMIDVAAEAAAVMRQFEGAAASKFVELQIAAQPGLTVRVDPGAFRAVLSDLLDTAIDQAAGGRVVLGATRSGNRIRISVSDDGAAADGRRREASLRDAERLAAMHGAVMRVDARPPEGTTVCYLLPTPDGTRRTRTSGEPTDPARVWTGGNCDRGTQDALH
jgi:hypothetical protein